MLKHPLAEVFGYPTDNFSAQAERYRANRYCPFNNSAGPKCTKDKADDPLGVCSVHHGREVAITCPVRLRQDWLIADDAKAFFFPDATSWQVLTEVRLKDKHGRSAGNIDVILVAYDDKGRITDFGALEVQAVYISGNVRGAFKHYMEDPSSHYNMAWPRQGYPRPDYLSSTRKRLVPQLLYKGSIFHAWCKKTAVAVHRGLFATLPDLPTVSAQEAELAWLVYDLQYDQVNNRYHLVKVETIYTQFRSAMDKLTLPEPGSVEDFTAHLQQRLDAGLTRGTPPDLDSTGLLDSTM
jgi:hypothetical protein